jgi:hypothetical protein
MAPITSTNGSANRIHYPRICWERGNVQLSEGCTNGIWPSLRYVRAPNS